MQKEKKIFFMNYGEKYWKLTHDENEAKSGTDYSLASHEDLNNWGCVGGFFTEGLLHIKEGIYKWNPKAVEEEWNGKIEYYGEYEEVN